MKTQAAHEDRAWLPYDEATVSKLSFNSDLTVLDFLDNAAIGADARMM